MNDSGRTGGGLKRYLSIKARGTQEKSEVGCNYFRGESTSKKTEKL